LSGGDGNDTLNGAGGRTLDLFGNVSRGSGETDILYGGEGADTFVLAGGSGRDGSEPNYFDKGERDLAIVLDFNNNEDAIVLSRTSSTPVTETVEVEYTLGALPEGLPSGTGIFANTPGKLPEQIAALPGIDSTTLDLNADYFQFI